MVGVFQLLGLKKAFFNKSACGGKANTLTSTGYYYIFVCKTHFLLFLIYFRQTYRLLVYFGNFVS